jgi:hypothetical protein
MTMMKHSSKVECVICVQDTAAEEVTIETAEGNAVVTELQSEPSTTQEATQVPSGDALTPAKKVGVDATQPALVTT